MAKDLSFDAFMQEQAGGAGKDRLSFDAFMEEANKPRKEEGGFLASAKQSAGAVIKGAGQAAGDYIPGVDQDNPITRYGQEVINANPTAVHSLSDIADKPWMATKEATGNAVGSVAGVVGARALGQGITAAAPMTGPAAPAVALLGQAIAWFGPVAIAALPSYGGIRDKQQLNDPQANESWKAKAIATLGAGAVGAIETRFGPQEWAMAALTKEGRAKLAEKFAETTAAKAIGFGALKGAAIEGGEELAQNPIEQISSYDNPLTKENLKDTAFGGVMGAIGGGVLGGGAGGLMGRSENRVINPIQKKPSVEDIGSAQTVDQAIATADAALAAPLEPAANITDRLAPANEVMQGARDREDMLAFMGSESRNLQVARAQLLEDNRKSRELDQIQQAGREDLGRLPDQQVANATAALDETPTAMQLAMQRALAKKAQDVSPPTAIQESPAAPVVGRSSDTPSGLDTDAGNGVLPQRALDTRGKTNQPAGQSVPPGPAGLDQTLTQRTPQNVQVETPFTQTPETPATPAQQGAVPATRGTPASLEAIGIAEPQKDGTALIRGDVQKILTELKKQGFTAVLKRQEGVLVGKSQAKRALEVFRAPVQTATEQPAPAQPVAPTPSARQVAIDAERARIEEKRVQRSATAKEAAKPMEGLSVGSMPNNAEPVTVKDGVVYVGKHPAQNFDTGEDVTVPAGATPQQIAAALKASGSMGRRAKFFGLPTETPATQTNSEPSLPSPEQQRADFAAAEKARTAPGNRARSRAHDANPFKAFIAKHGINSALASDFAPGQKERQAAMVQGYGPIFRKAGLQLDALAELAVQDGYLTTPDVTRLSAMINDALHGKRIIPQYAEGAAENEMETRGAIEKDAGEEQNAEVEAETRAEREAIQALADLSDESLQALAADDAVLTASNNVSEAEFLRALGASEQEIQDATQGQGRKGQSPESRPGPQETAPGATPGSDQGRDGETRAYDEGKVGERVNPQEEYQSIIDDLSDDQVEALFKKSGLAGKKATTAEKRAMLRAEDEADIFPIYEKMADAGELPFDDAGDRFTPEEDWGYKVATFPKPEKTVNAVKDSGPYIAPDKAAEIINSWKAEAKRIGKTEDHSNEVIISLFDESGEISKPWREAGYDVMQYDIKLGDDLMEYFPIADIQRIKESGKRVVGVLAQPPCTTFTSTGARWHATHHDVNDRNLVNKMFGPKAARYFSKPHEYTQALVSMVDLMIGETEPTFFAMENPNGGAGKTRIESAMGLPEPTLIFNPNNYGDPYTKKTLLWGNFNPNLPTANVDPTQGSLMHKLWSRAEKGEGLRSRTPEGFAYAFFMANKDHAKGDLTAPTRADVLAQQDRTATADTRDQREQVRKESEAGAGQFSLTQEDGRQDTTRDLFDQPNEPEQEKPISQMSAADLLRAAADKMEGKSGKIDDLGEKIGGARKDTAVSTGTKRNRSGQEEDNRPAWAKRFQISEIVRAGGQIGEVRNEGRWVIRDTRSLDWMKQPKQVGRETFVSREAAEKALPLLAVAQKHRVVPVNVAKPKTEADVDAQLKADMAAKAEDDNRPGRIEAMVMQSAQRKLDAGEITQAQFDTISEKYAEAAAKYTPPTARTQPVEPTQAWEIWRDISDRKRVKVVNLQFASRDDAMRYMAEHATEIMEANTTFGEADLPVPENKQRIGAERRRGDVKGEDFRSTFGFRGVEFGNWNNQDERQQLMNEAYDGLMDLAEVMGIPSKAISLNGDLALAFGARGHGLSGARAHYEPDRAVMNLTKMKGAGALAHEWFHALDHYFGRQDGKAPVTWVTNTDGTRSLKVNGDFESNAVSNGFSRTNSGVRAEVRDAINKVMTTMAKKAEQYVEDTAKTERFVAAVRNDVDQQLTSIRRDLAEQKDVRYWKRNNKPATAEQLAEFDAIAQRILAGEALDTELRASGTKTLTGMRWTNDALEQISTIYKAVRGRSGFDSTDQNGILDRLRQRMSLYSARLKMLAEAQTGAEKTKQVPTDFAMDAKSLDQGRGTDYWTTPHEMAARAFQGYVEDKIAERGGKSPFLNYGPENAGILTPWGAKRPYPAGAERKAINAAFDELVDVIQTRETEQGVAMYSRRSPIWRSAMRDGIEGINAKSQPAEGWRAQISGLISNGKVKADEVEWTGINDWLKLQTGKVTKAKMLEFLDANGVQVKEVTLGDDGQRQAYINELNGLPREDLLQSAEDAGVDIDSIDGNRTDIVNAIVEAQEADLGFGLDRPAGTAKYGQYTLPGGENYREVLLTLPERPPAPHGIELRRAIFEEYQPLIDAADAKTDALVGKDRAAFDAAFDAAMELRNKRDAEADAAYHLPADTKPYRSGHWDQKNILAHIRVNDRTDTDGKRVLFVEEIQSDWGQDGKKKGFAKELSPEAKEFRDLDSIPDAQLTPEQRARGRVLLEIVRRENEQHSSREAVPIAPFVTKTDAWLNLALKRVITMAAQEGYDRVAFVNGEQSAERYDLSKQVSKVEYEKTDAGGYEIEVYGMDGREIMREGQNEDGIGIDRVEELLGKELAKKIANGEGRKSRRAYREWTSLEGLDLKVGGEGMKAFYNQIVPAAVKKLLPKVGGGTLEEIKFNPETYHVAGKKEDVASPSQQPGFDITDAMREKASGGLPMFSRGTGSGVPMPDAKAVVSTIRKALPKAPQIILHESVDKAPKALLRVLHADNAERNVEAVYHAGEIHVFPGNIDSIERMMFVVGHHEIRHHGLRSMLGPNLNDLMLKLYQNESVKSAAQAKLDAGLAKTRVMAVEEALADMPVEELVKLNGFKKLVAAVRQWLRAFADRLRQGGFNNLADALEPKQWTDNDIAALVSKAEDVSRNGIERYSTGGTAFSTFDPENHDVRYSRKLIVGQTSRKHTSQQLRAMRNVGFEVDVPTMKERAQALWQDAGKKLAQGIVDQFAPVKDLDKGAYGLLRLAKGASGAFEVFLHGGKLKLTDGVYDFDDQNKGGVIDKLLIPLQGEHHDFMRWIAANRAERLTAEGRENLFSPQDIADLKTLADGTTEFDYTVQTGPRAGTVTRDRTLIYADSQRIFNAFNKNVLDLAEQSGLIDGASRHLWEHEFYVPFYRVADEDGGIRGANIKGGVVRQEAFKKLKGGAQELNADLLDNTLMNWAHLLDAAAKNRAAKATIEAAEKMGAATQVPSGTKKSVWFMDKGEKHHAVVDDPYLLTALTSLEYAGMRNPVMNAMGTFKHYLTMGVTASPFFKVRNLIRDSMQVVATSGISPNVLTNVGKGWALTNPQSDEYFRLMAGGGTIHFGTMLEGSEAKRVQSLVESGVDDATILNDEHKIKRFYRKFVEPSITAYNELGNRGEAINRASLYDQLRKQGMGHAEASLQARDLMDFSMQGSFTTIRFLTQVVPFFNARLQGMYKLGRATKEDPKRMAAVIGATSLMSIALLGAYGDDDDWKKREEWDRNNYWWFKFGGTAFRIPKPFEIGAMATLAERGFELMFDDEMTGKRFRKQVLTLLSDNLSMNPVPQLVKPVLDVYANKDSFTGRPIETMGMDRLESKYRFTDRTSMTARATSTAANAVTGLVGVEGPSPVQIDHMLRGYFGWLGAFVVGAGDIIARPLTGQAERASPDLWKTATGGMIANLDDAPSRYVSQMYDQAQEIERAYATWKNLVREGKTLEAGEYLKENRGDISKHRSVSAVKAQETRLNQRIRMIEHSNMDPDKKREQIRILQDQKDRIARRLSN